MAAAEPTPEPGIADELPRDIVETIRAFTGPAAALLTGDLVDRLSAVVTALVHDAYGRGWQDGFAARPVAVEHHPALVMQLNGALRHGTIGQG